MSSAASEQSARGHARTARRRTTGGFGVGTLLAELFGLYGVVLVVIGIAGRSDDTGGVGANLWAGVAMLVVALLVAAWSLRRSVVADAPADDGRTD
jgi:hypothetical protein